MKHKARGAREHLGHDARGARGTRNTRARRARGTRGRRARNLADSSEGTRTFKALGEQSEGHWKGTRKTLEGHS